jgi:signal transduction histidine kinase
VKKPINILLLEDNAADAQLLELMFQRGGLGVAIRRVERKSDFVRELERQPLDIILSDYALPAFDGLAALAIARVKRPDVPFLFVTGTMGEEVAIETLKKGATDYVLKTRLSRLVPSVHRALGEAQERSERRRAVQQLRESHEQLRALSAHLQTVREDERTRIAREVHDELGQALTGLKLDLSRLGHPQPRVPRSHTGKIKSLVARIDAIIRTVRRIATELRPGILDDLGLVAAIEWQANDFQSRTGIQCIVRTSLPEKSGLSAELNTAFFRIFQETLTNVIRHADALLVDVQLRKEPGHVVLEVRDNGRGITDTEISGAASLGLRGMRERAALLGGEVAIRGVPREGTTVTVWIPLGRAAPTKKRHENTHRGRPHGCAPGLAARAGR